MKTLISIVAAGGFIASGCATSQNNSPDLASAGGMEGPVLKSEFIYNEAPFPSCHASTIAETPQGLVAAWFGGTDEGEKDVGIWFARHDAQQWSTPVEVANGIQADGTRHPCWNPVLHQADGGPLVLFYKVGPSPSQWWGMRITSADGGASWSTPERLPEGQLGPVRSKPVSWENGALLCGSSSEHDGWRVHMELTPDLGKTWKRTGSLNDPAEFGAIQPTILKWGDGRVQILCRSRQGRLTESWMGDTWTEWSPMRATALPNPSSGADAVMLRSGRALLVYNHTTRGRHFLNLAASDDGRAWKAALAIENQPGEYSYPAIIQTSDGRVHVTYTWKRQRIKHVVIDPDRLQLHDMEDGRWPAASLP